MTRSRLLAAAALVGVAAYLLAWAPAPNPGLTGPSARSVGFSALQAVAPDLGDGPEAETPGPGGFLYTGLQDGWIVRVRPDGQGPAERVGPTGGRPLGMQFDANGHLIVADGFRGLLSMAPDRTLTVPVEAVDGQRLLFPMPSISGPTGLSGSRTPRSGSTSTTGSGISGCGLGPRRGRPRDGAAPPARHIRLVCQYYERAGDRRGAVARHPVRARVGRAQAPVGP
jgi:hypothetical protein